MARAALAASSSAGAMISSEYAKPVFSPANTLLDAGIAFLDDAILQRPALLARQLEIKVGGIHGRTQHQPERLLDPADIKARGRENSLADITQRVEREGCAGG